MVKPNVGKNILTPSYNGYVVGNNTYGKLNCFLQRVVKPSIFVHVLTMRKITLKVSRQSS
jgi:hypothetical protein